MEDLNKVSKEVRKRILIVAEKSQTSHIACALSSLDIIIALYYKILKEDDVFILSKGHGGLGLYGVLEHKGIISKEHLDHFFENGTELPIHPILSHKHKIFATTGSLGHGLPISAGIALSNKLDKKDDLVFTMISDGECDEGSNWEAFLFATHHKLKNLIVIIDYNKLQCFGKTNEVMNLEPLTGKLESFNWKVMEINGHDFKEIVEALEKAKESENPTVVIAHTIKGKGIDFMENNNDWHSNKLNKEYLDLALKQL